jgi:hypothetical protein
MSLRGNGFLSVAGAGALAVLAAALPMTAQYPGQVAKSAKDAPVLRSIAVLEWTGDQQHPKASRLVPILLLDAGELEDGGIYLARPVPFALAGNVEYELQQNGKPTGLFDVLSAGQEQGGWVGHGGWKPLPVAKAKAEEKKPKPIEDENSERPVLHRKHPAGDHGDDKSEPQPAAPDDPDRPRLHKKDSGDSSASSSTGADTGASAPSDPDRPVLRKKTSSDNAESQTSSGGSSTSPDPDRPTLKKNRKKPEDEGRVASIDVTDPDRPRLKRGKADMDELKITPTLLGLPPELQQAVAVSDAKTRPEHPWSFSWADPEDEGKMKAALEEIARNALGLNPPPPPPAPAPKRTPARKTAKPVAPAPPPEPAPLMDEQFRVFELAYGSGATLVLSAHDDAPSEQRKFVTLVAQPDLYGNLLVLLKNVTDSAHLDENPRLRLVDAVDALADNRGELLFELRGATQRKFVLYRVLRGRAEELFSGGEAVYGAANRE